MAFPVVEDTNAEQIDTSTTSHTVTLPTNASGELMMVFAIASPTGLMSMSGWSTLINNSTTSGNDVVVFYKTSTGSEATATLTISASDRLTYQAFAISGWNALEVSTGSRTTANKPDPDSLTPSWGVDDTLWFACTAQNNKIVTVDPSGWASPIRTGANLRPCMGTARLESAAATVDPPTFTISATFAHFAFTIAIEPGGAAPTQDNDNLTLLGVS